MESQLTESSLQLLNKYDNESRQPLSPKSGEVMEYWENAKQEIEQKQLLDFDNFKTNHDDNIRKGIVVRNYLSAHHNLTSRDSLQNDLNRQRIAITQFDGKGADSDEEFFEVIQGKAIEKRDTSDYYKELSKRSMLHILKNGDSLEPVFHELKSLNGSKFSKPEHEAQVVNAVRDRLESHMSSTGINLARDIFKGFEAEDRSGFIDLAKSRFNKLTRDESDQVARYIGFLASQFPKTEKDSFIEYFGESFRGVASTGRNLANVKDRLDSANANMRSGNEVANALARSQGGFHPLSNDSARLARDQVDENNFVEQVIRTFEQQYDPTDFYADDNTILGAIERGVHATPGTASTVAVAMVPYVGWAASGGLMFENSKQRFNQLAFEQGHKIHEVDKKTDGYAMVDAGVNTILERMGARALLGKSSIGAKALSKINQKISKNIASKAVVGLSGELGTELTQDIWSNVVQDMASVFEEEIPEVDWEKHFENYHLKVIETAVSIAPISIAMAAAQNDNEWLELYDSLHDDQKTIFGFAKKNRDTFEESRGTLNENAALRVLMDSQDPNSPEAVAATDKEAKRLREAEEVKEKAIIEGILPQINVAKGEYEVINPVNQESIGKFETLQETTNAVEQYLEHHEMQERDLVDYTVSMVELADAQVQLNEGLEERFQLKLGERMDIDKLAQISQRHAEDARKQSELQEYSEGGDGSITEAILGSSQTQFEDGQRVVINEIFAGANATTIIHESTHGQFRRALDTGSLTREGTIDLFKEIDKSLEGRGFNLLGNKESISNTELDEAVSLFVEADTLGTLKGKATPQSRAIRKNLKAIAKQTGKNAGVAGRFRSFLRAARRFFETAFVRSALIKKGIRDGVIDENKINEFRAALQGTTQQEEHNKDVEKEYGKSFSLGNTELADALIGSVADRVKDPEKRVDIFNKILSNLDKVKRGIEKDAIADPKTKKDIREEAEREYDRFFRQKSGRLSKSSSLQQALKDSKEHKEEWIKERIKEQEKDNNPKERTLRYLKQLDSIILALPIELRGKIGGHTQLAKLNTNNAALKFLEKRIDKVEKVVDRWIKDTALEDFAKLLKKAQPSRKSGQKPKGKIGADGHRFFNGVESVLELDQEQIEDEKNKLMSRLAEPDLEDDKMLDLSERLQIAQMFGGLKNKHTEEVLNALDLALDTYTNKRNAWRIREENRLDNVKKLVSETLEALGNPDTSDVQDSKKKDGSFVQNVLNLDWSAISFSEVMEKLLGRDNKLSELWGKQVRRAMDKRTAEIAKAHKRWRDVTERATGLKGRKAQLKIWEMQTKQSVKASPVKNKSTEIKVPIDTFLDSQARSELGLSKSEIEEVQKRINQINDNRNRKYITITRETSEKGKEASFTESEAIYLSMLYKQEDYVAAMDRHGFGETFQSVIEKQISDEGKILREYLAGEYEKGYEPLRKLYANMHGMDLPKVGNYTPGVFYSTGGDITLDVTGGGVVEGGLMQGFLKDRKKHTAKPRVESAFAIYFNHLNQTEHWKSMAELSRELNGVFKNAEVKEALHAVDQQAPNIVSNWLKAIDGNGLNNGDSNKVGEWLYSTQSALALSWKIGTIAKNFVGASINAAYNMPAGQFFKGYGRLISGKIDIKKIWESDLIQTRIEAGFSPEARAAISKSFGSKPTIGSKFVQKGFDFIGVADAMGTTLGAAITYDYHFNRIKDEMGETNAHIIALDEAAETIARTAQPVEVTNKSLIELQSTNFFAKLAFVFKSEARQKSAMFTRAWINTIKGKPTKRDIQTIILSHFVVAPMMHTITQIIRDVRDEDDDEVFDDKYWGWEGFAMSMATGPLSGLPLISEIFDGFNSDDAGPLSRVVKGVDSLADIFKDDLKGDDFEWYEKKAVDVIQGIGGSTGATAGSVYEQFTDIARNFSE